MGRHFPVFCVKKTICYIAYRTSASTSFATEAAGIVGHLVHISAPIYLQCSKGRARASYGWVILIHHIVASSTVMPYMKELPAAAATAAAAAAAAFTPLLFAPGKQTNES